MDQRSPSFEATILSLGLDLPNPLAIALELSEALQAHGAALQGFEKITPSYFLMSTAELQVLIALSDEALPMEGFMAAARPDGPEAEPSGALLDKLTAVRSNVTIVVLPKPSVGRCDAAALEQMQRVCWDVTHTLLDGIPAALVFWAETETLYDAEHFLTEAAPQTRDRSEPQGRIAQDQVTEAPHLAGPPALGPEVIAWFNGDADNGPVATHRSPTRASASSRFMSLFFQSATH